MDRWQKGWVGVLFLALGGCAMAPGMHYADEGRSSWLKSDTAPTAVVPRLEKIELTPKTVALEPSYQPSVPAALLDYEPAEYRLGPHDVVQLVVWDHPELTVPGANDVSANAREIDVYGRIFVPYAGEVEVAGLTVAEARKLIARRLSRFIESPQVDLVIKSYGSQRFTVGGEVNKPGVQVLGSQPINLLDAIGLAGGFTELADRTRITLVRDGRRYTLDLARLMQIQSADIARIYIKNGDVIQVADNTSQRVYVIGEVGKPEPVPFTTHGLTLTEALGNAGGVSQNSADAGSIYVIRAASRPEEAPRIYHLDADSPVALIVADSFQLRPRDVIFVGAAAVTRWNRVISQLLPTLNIVNTTRNLR